MSRKLPARPNLEFLKNEAKDRLVALRRADPRAQLSDAQFALSKDYGFVSWPKLKEHESNRLREMPRLIRAMRSYNGETIDAPADHRVVMAIAMRANYDGPSLGPEDFENPGCVAKSWPRFWDFLQFAIDRVIPQKKPFKAPA